MSFIRRPYRNLDRKKGFPAAAAILFGGLILTAAGSQAAQGESDRPSVDAVAMRLVRPGCGNDSGEARKFVVSRAVGGTRSMELCDGGDARDPAATAKALSDAIDAEGDPKFYADPRMPELLSLRLARSRTDMDPSLSSEERMKSRAALDAEIVALESAMAKSSD
jgi:hypothetical protein